MNFPPERTPVEFGGCNRAYALLQDKCAKHDKQHGGRTLKPLLLLLLLRRKNECKELESYFLLNILGRENFGGDKVFCMTAAKFEELLNDVVPHK